MADHVVLHPIRLPAPACWERAVLARPARFPSVLVRRAAELLQRGPRVALPALCRQQAVAVQLPGYELPHRPEPRVLLSPPRSNW